MSKIGLAIFFFFMVATNLHINCVRGTRNASFSSAKLDVPG